MRPVEPGSTNTKAKEVTEHLLLFSSSSSKIAKVLFGFSSAEVGTRNVGELCRSILMASMHSIVAGPPQLKAACGII